MLLLLLVLIIHANDDDNDDYNEEEEEEWGHDNDESRFLTLCYVKVCCVCNQLLDIVLRQSLWCL